MTHFAKLDDNNRVVFVTVGRDEDDGLEDELSQQTGETYKQTSYTGTFRKNFAGIGYTYDEERDAFIPPQPFQSWTLDDTTCLWEPPVPYPDDGNLHVWSEDDGAWLPA